MISVGTVSLGARSVTSMLANSSTNRHAFSGEVERR